MPNAGKFRIEVREPYPCWCEIWYDGALLKTIPHTEIRDLEFVVDRAKAEAARKLGTNEKDEIL